LHDAWIVQRLHVEPGKNGGTPEEEQYACSPVPECTNQEEPLVVRFSIHGVPPFVGTIFWPIQPNAAKASLARFRNTSASHSRQNFLVSRFSNWHLGHFIFDDSHSGQVFGGRETSSGTKKDFNLFLMDLGKRCKGRHFSHHPHTVL
jgi:hypothetical protein